MPSIVTIDENRITQVNGKSFFLVGARHMPLGANPAILAEAGFNAYRTLDFGHEVKDPDPLPGPNEDILFWSYIYDHAVLGRCPDYKRQLEDYVKRVKDHPALLCYENFNEVATLWSQGRPKALPDELREGTAVLKELDPNHPVWLAHSCERTVETLSEYNPCTDIVGCNPYPVLLPGMRQHVGFRADGEILDCPDRTIHAVGKYTEKMMRVSDGQMPVWMLIQAMANENWFNPNHTPEMAGQTIDESKILYPTFEQMRFMAYDAIISGATGLAFALWKTSVDSDVWQHIKRLARELCGLNDALTAPPCPQQIEISYTDLGYTIWDGVRTLARSTGDDIFLFAANTAFDPAQVLLRFPMELSNVALVESEGRQVAVENDMISDYFEPYAVHVYKVRQKRLKH